MAGPNPPLNCLSTLAFRRALQPRLVSEIKAAIKRDQGWDATSNYSLHKADLTQEEQFFLESGVAPSLSGSLPLSDFDQVSKHWPQGFSLPGRISVIVDKSTGEPDLSHSGHQLVHSGLR